jgi:hypothetical protein
MRYINFLFYCASGFIFTFGVSSDNGKAGATGAPGENNCTNCHAGTAVNGGSGSITITSDNLNNWEYVPGQTYNFSVTVSEANRSLFGFGIEALQSSGANGGTLNSGIGSSIKNATVGGNSRRNVVHQLNAGTGAGSHTFNFTWVAPTSNIGDVTLYTAGVAANGNGSDTGDHVYKTSQVITPSAGTQINEYGVNNSWKALSLSGKKQLNVKGDVTVPGKLAVQVYNMQGQVVWDEQNIIVPSGSVSHIIDLSSFSSELYIVKAYLNEREVLNQIFFN